MRLLWGRRLWRRAGGVMVCTLLFGLPAGSSCGADHAALLPERENDEPDAAGARLVARLVHVSDTHIVDSQSPARFAGAQALAPYAWRAWENGSAQLLDGIIRTANRIHASGERIDFLLHTGDVCDNAQGNELSWFLAVMDGRPVVPLSGPDDRDPETLPPEGLDPYAPFVPQGLYRCGVHGPLASIPWYALAGNHDCLGLGVFPIVTRRDGSRVTPLPLPGRPGVLLPTVLDPTGSWSYGPVSPARPGPPPLFNHPAWVVPVPERRYFSKAEFVQAMFQTDSGPAGHGFSSPGGPAWYSVSPVPGLRLIGLDSSDVLEPVPGLPYDLGCISRAGREFLQGELDAASARGEWVIVATHHPSGDLEVLYGSALGPVEFRGLLNQYPNVVVHLAGHRHRNRVTDRGGYIEIETCSTLDPPLEARVVEIWQGVDGAAMVAYRMFSGVDDRWPPLGEDPLRGLREQVEALARSSKRDPALRRSSKAADPNPEGDRLDREGLWRKPRPAPALAYPGAP